jgi:hypothetical protein
VFKLVTGGEIFEMALSSPVIFMMSKDPHILCRDQFLDMENMK